MPSTVAVQSDVAERTGQRVGQINEFVDFVDLPGKIRQGVEDVGRVLKLFQLRFVRPYHRESDPKENDGTFTKEQVPHPEQHTDVQNGGE